MPFGVTPATDGDYEAFLRLFPELEVPEAPPSAEKFARNVVPHALFLREAREGGAVLGYVFARPRGDVMHVVHVIVDPAARRRGVGRALMDAVAASSRAAGFSRWMLNVKPENAAARALYEACKMHVTFESVSMLLHWADEPRLAEPRGAASPLRPEDDAAFEAALGLPRGEISAFRAVPDRRIFAVHDDGPAAVGAFDATFPGVSPFYARSAGHARALLDAIRPHALHDHLRLFVENDDGLEEALARAGATPALRVLRMEGEIP